MAYSRLVTDTRTGGSGDTTSADRQRFIRRAKAQIKEAVKRAITTGDIKSLEKGNIKVPVKDMNEPQLEHDGRTGTRDRVYTGNKDWVPGDKIDKPPQGQGSGKGSEASEDGEGSDPFNFVLTPNEFYDFLFEDLALPDLMKKSMKTITKVVRRRAGYVTSGNPAQLDIKKSYQYAFARHKALGRPSNAEIEAAVERVAETSGSSHQYDYEFAVDQLQQLRMRQSRVPFLDDIDLHYRNYPPRPEPITKAVMMCIMDVSGSMDEQRKDLAKRFFLLLYVWLMKQYNQKVEIVFIRHHSKAEEVDEHTFFYDQESGGTVVSTAIVKAKEIIKERYPVSEWNIYACHASDGDNWDSDNEEVIKEMTTLMPNLQFFGYLQVAGHTGGGYGTNLWPTYQKVGMMHRNFSQVMADAPEKIWTVFKELFTKDLNK